MRPFRVYFMRPVGAEGPVKIGCSTMVEERLRALSPWAPFPLEVVATIPGDTRLEGRFHLKFMADRVHGEWFAASAELSATIAEVAAGKFDIDSLPSGPRVNWSLRKPVEWAPERRKGVGLRARLRILSHKTGMCPVRELDDLANGFEGLTPSEREDAERRILHFLEDPINRGAVLPYPWCPETFTKWAISKGISPNAMPPCTFIKEAA